MTILDTILGAVQGATATNEGSNNTAIDAIIGLIGDQQSGGLMGLVEKFSASGLGEQAASWVSVGQNLPITAEQIQAVLGSSFVQDIAANMGINTADAAGSLASLLPQVIDKLTPDGQVSNNNDLLQMALTGLSSLLTNKST